MKKITTLLLGLLLMTAPASAQKYVGGDISCLPLCEKANAKYMNHSGKSYSDALQLFKDEKLNAMRVRLFVDPTGRVDNGDGTSYTDDNVCQDLEWVKALGKRIKASGMKFMLDFHYSYTWADPGKQWTPAAWASLTDAQLQTKLYEYTKDALQQLKAAGAEPDLIQTGNEISYGMLWGTVAQAGGNSGVNRCYTSSSSANWNRFIALLKKAGQACREVCPDAKIILHSERVPKPNVMKDFYDRMKNSNVDYDVIGLSYYPYFHGNLATLEVGIKLMEQNYPDKEIMIVETGYPYAWAVQGTPDDYVAPYAYSDEGQAQYTDALITMLNKHAKVTGLFWWFMEYNAYNTSLSGWYNAPLFDSRNGKACSAMSKLQNFLGETSGIDGVKSEERGMNSDLSYNLAGQLVNEHYKGIVIKNGKKFLTKN